MGRAGSWARPYLPGTEVSDGLQERMGNVEPLHQPRLAKDMARTRSRLLRKLLAVRWGGREGLLQQAGIREAKSEQDEGETAG